MQRIIDNPELWNDLKLYGIEFKGDYLLIIGCIKMRAVNWYIKQGLLIEKIAEMNKLNNL